MKLKQQTAKLLTVLALKTAQTAVNKSVFAGVYYSKPSSSVAKWLQKNS